MSSQFFAERAGPDAPVTKLGITETRNPFLTDAYVSALQIAGRECWILGTRNAAAVVDAAVAYVQRGRLSTMLEIPSLPASAASESFWDCLYGFCKRLKVTDLVGGTFASPSFEIPPLKGETSRTPRIEYVVSLDGSSPGQLSSNHKRNVKKANAAGVVLRHGCDAEKALAEHHRLMGQSLGRRSARGEFVQQNWDSAGEHRAYLQTGAAEIFQAMQGETVLSSVLVLRSANAAYYESAGTSPEGMSVGASHFLIHSIAEHLRNQGVAIFILGGAESGSSLARFKSGFGASEVRLTTCTCYLGPAWRRRVRSAYAMARENPRALAKAIRGDRYTLLVYAVDTESAAESVRVPEGARFVPLSEQDLTNIAVDPSEPGFRDRQIERLQRYGKSYAFGVFISDWLAHVSWMLPAEAVCAEMPQILQLAANEVEITACETLPQFRGKNLYAFAVQQLIAIARQQGVRRVYMKTHKNNAASQSGILKAGLKSVGTISVVTPPLAPGRSIVLRKLHA